MNLSIYIHIPFCKRKCNYCDFASFAGKEDLIDQYISVIASEAKQSLSFLPTTCDLKLKTIYIGGGTPSLLSPKQLEKILETLKPWHLDSARRPIQSRTLSVVEGFFEIEITLECNPGTVDLEKLKAYRDLGINRLSIGAQSFDDNELKILGRIHTAKDIYETVENARKAGFENINLDLIFALPNQTLDNWKQTLSKAAALNVEHISTYNLQIEEKTPFHLQLKTCDLRLPEEEIEAQMYEYAMDYLPTKRYKQYEISNFSKPGFECKHNIVYWKNGNYLGLGVSAASHINGKRFENTSDLKKYLSYAQCSMLGVACSELEHKSQNTDLRTREISDTIFMNLRLLEGIDKQEFKERFNQNIEDLYAKEIQELVRDGLIDNNSDHLKFTRHGILLANEVFKKFI